METNFERQAAEHPGTVPVSADAKYQFGSMAVAHESIAAIWKAEHIRLSKQAYRLVHKIAGADVDGIVSDAALYALEHWEAVKDAEHCRKMLATVVRNACLNVIRIGKDTVEADGRTADPRSRPSTSRSTDATTAWLFGLCADDTERLILSLWLEPGNQTAGATAAASQAGVYVMVDGIRRWFKPAWTALEVNQLLRRLRERMGVQVAPRRKLWERTIGTLPGLHFESFKRLGVVLLTCGGGYGPRAVRVADAPMSAVPHTAWVAGEWVHGTDAVMSYQIGGQAS